MTSVGRAQDVQGCLFLGRLLFAIHIAKTKKRKRSLDSVTCLAWLTGMHRCYKGESIKRGTPLTPVILLSHTYQYFQH